MTGDPAIRAALREAAQCLEGSWAAGEPLKDPEEMAAETIAAFLRALPDRFAMPGTHNPDCRVWGHASGEMKRLAAAVTLAAEPPDA